MKKLICLSACLAGEVSGRLLRNDYAGAKKADIVEKWQDAVVGD